MKKIAICLCCLWACCLWACSDNDEIGYEEDWVEEYVFPQGKSDADDRIVAFYEQYGTYILYEYTYLDYRYELNTWNYELPDPIYVGDMLDFLNEIWFDFYSDDFKKQYLPLKIMLSKYYENYGYEYFCQVGSSCVGIGYCTDTLYKFTPEEKLLLKQELQTTLWSNYLSMVDVPEEFFALSSYASVADTDPESDNYARKRGFVEQYSIGNSPSEWYTSGDYFTGNGEIDESRDLDSFIMGMILRTSEDWAKDLEWPLVKQKYDILRNWIQETFGFDLQKVGDTTYE